MVVDLAVENDRQRTVRRRHRLLSAGDVEDGEAAETQVHAAIGFDQERLVIRPTVRDACGHAPQRCFIPDAEESGDAAHLQPASSWRTMRPIRYTALPCDS